jgi:23S rRNA (cytosine1962-C5)-methyltransferase
MCARAGASEVVGLDASEAAVALAKENARRNGVEAATTFRVADVFDELPRLAAAKAKFDVVILDPPSLAKTRRALSGAVRGYIHLNKVALGLLKPGGLLATCSCSHHISRDGFRETLRTAASLARKQAAVIGAGGQPEDHPSLLGVPESDYLKCFLLAVI